MSCLWNPQPHSINNSNLSGFRNHLKHKSIPEFKNYLELHRWSVENRGEFWSEFWDYAKIISQLKGKEFLKNQDDIVRSQFFPQAKLNYAENVLSFAGGTNLSQDALIFRCENQLQTKLNRRELIEQVSKCAQVLKSFGVESGDRVAGLLHNGPEAIIAMLATASLGAVWSSASPDFGVQGVIDRFGQIEPKVLIAVDGYWYNSKKIDCREKIMAIQKSLPTLNQVLIVSLLKLGEEGISDFQNWSDCLAQYSAQKLEFTSVDFRHPLFIMFSSGTTGVPKCIVHGHGGTLIQHLKEHQLHGDLKPNDRLFYFTTLGWMMWNWLVTGLASGATLLLYDGSPFASGGELLFRFAEEEKCTHFGVSAKFLDTCHKMQLKPQQKYQFPKMRTIFSTGSPLSPEGFDYVYQNIKSDVCLSSISGGTDIISCFILGNPELPVWRGEIQCAGLGMDIQIFDESGKSIKGQKGELVCARSFPSQPLGFWKDLDGKKYYEAYFARFKNVWCHGDFVQQTEHQGFVVFGRSDAVLNPGGVRIGTAEIYRQVEKLPEVLESIAVGQDWQGDVRVVLFVKLKENVELTQELQESIKKTIRDNTTTRHVPAKIIAVDDIPRTKSGKITELAVRKLIHGEKVENVEALANPEALKHFKDRNELKT